MLPVPHCCNSTIALDKTWKQFMNGLNFMVYIFHFKNIYFSGWKYMDRMKLFCCVPQKTLTPFHSDIWQNSVRRVSLLSTLASETLRLLNCSKAHARHLWSFISPLRGSFQEKKKGSRTANLDIDAPVTFQYFWNQRSTVFK